MSVKLLDVEEHTERLTRRYIGIRSVSEDKKTRFSSQLKMAKSIQRELTRLGFESDIDKNGNLTCGITVNTGSYLLIASHHDTKDVDNVKWEYDNGSGHKRFSPFKGLMTDEAIYGRGAVDMKSNIAASICALYLLRQDGMPGNIYFVSTVNEELSKDSNRRQGLPYALKNLEGEIGAAVITEPTDLRPALWHRGRFVGEITFYGNTCHGGDITEADSAKRKASHFFEALDALVGRRFNYVELDSDSRETNTVPGRVVMGLEWRTYDDPQRFIDTLNGLLYSLEVTQPELAYKGTKFETLGLRKPFHGDPESRIAQAFTFRADAGTAQVAGFNTDENGFMRMPYSTDATYTANNSPPIQTVIFGVGDPRLAHQFEYVRRSNLREAPSHFAQGIRNYFELARS